MSSTSTEKIDALIDWLGENAFWNADLVEVRPSKIGGTGVFWKLGPEDDPDQDRLLLRIPKSNILSPKNSCIYSLLVDHESEDLSIDLTSGMRAMVLAFIYELNLGDKSPWYAYLSSFSWENAGVPICLWDEDAKAALFNTECDLLNMLDATEIAAFYWECVRFARNNQKLVPIPEVFDTTEITEKHLLQFGQYLQAVISRAFAVDKYHGLALVPGADLFNHLSPEVSDESIEFRENAHFECDDDEDLCGDCGETECGHESSEVEDSEEGEEEEEELSEEENDEENEENEENENNEIEESDEIEIDEDNEDEEGLSIEDFLGLMEEDGGNIEDSDSSEGEDNEMDADAEDSMDEEDEEEFDEEFENKPITLEDIENIEMESEDDTEQDDEEVSTVSLSEDEQEENGFRISPNEEELAKELGDGSKCCDIVMQNLPEAKYNYEIFNTYGNELSNPYLLQRYGFVSPGNPNTTCLLTVQMYAELKKMKETPKTAKQLELKLAWYEERGFAVVNELCSKADSQGHEHGAEDEHKAANGCGQSCEDEDCEDGCDEEGADGCQDSCCGDSEDEAEEMPESWELSVKLDYDGMPSRQAIALVRLMQMRFNFFFHKLLSAPSERRHARRVEKYLLEADVTDEEKAVLKRWALERLNRYKPESAIAGPHSAIVKTVLAEEKAVLARAVDLLS